MNILSLLFQHWGEIYTVLTSLVTIASVASNYTKTDKDNRAVGVASKVINAAAINIDKLKTANSQKYNQ